MPAYQVANNTNSNAGGRFIQFANNAAVQEHLRRVAEAQAGIQSERYINELEAYVLSAKESAIRAKQTSGVETRLINAVKRYKGEYTNTKLAQIRQYGGSEVYMKETGVKCRAASSLIQDVVTPQDGKVWGFVPSPNPEIEEDDLAEVSRQVTEEFIQRNAQQMGVDVSQLGPEQMAAFIEQIGQENFMKNGQEVRERIDESVNDLAKYAADQMHDEIQDQMEAGGWREAIHDWLLDFPVFPAAFLKWEFVREPKIERVLTSNGWVTRVNQKVVKKFKTISPFDIYPSPESGDINSGFIFERIKATRSYLNSLKGVRGYDSNSIDIILDRYQNGGRHEHLHTDQERAEVEDRPNEFSYRNDNIDMWEFHGKINGLLLSSWGYEFDRFGKDDPNTLTKEYEVKCVLVEDVVICVEINSDPLGQRPYFKSSYVKLAGSFWGLGVPDLMEDTQGILNATARALVNNMALGAGPMVGIHTDRLADGEVPGNLHPQRIFQFKNPTQSTARPIEFFQAETQAERLINVMRVMKKFADDQTGIPAYAHGDQSVGGAGRTASGLTILMQNANLLVKLAIANIDRDVIRPIVEHFYTFNMIHNPDQSIKGDLQIVATGALGQIVKEAKLASIQNFRASTSNPIDQQIIGEEGRAELLREEAGLLGIKNVIPENYEIAARIAEQAQQIEAQNQAALEEEQRKVKDQLTLQDDEQDFELVKLQEQHKNNMALEQLRQNGMMNTARIQAKVRENADRQRAQKQAA